MYQQKVMSLSDFDASDFELEQKALANSMESYFRQEHGRKQKAAAPIAASSGRRRRESPLPLPSDDHEPLYSSSYAAAAVPAASVATLPIAAASSTAGGASLSAGEEYPETVQELVMNGFELEKVLRAYEFMGDRFDDLLSFLLSSGNS